MEDIVEADTQIGKIAKKIKYKQCLYKDCKVLIKRGKYCSPHSYDVRLEANRKK